MATRKSPALFPSAPPSDLFLDALRAVTLPRPTIEAPLFFYRTERLTSEGEASRVEGAETHRFCKTEGSLW